MEQSIWNIVISCVFFTTVISSTKSEQIVTQVFRFAGKDIFKNPEHSSYTECGVNTCTKYQAQCLEDGNCCLCLCNFKFSTYNVSEARCLADKIILSDSAFRFIRGEELHTGIPTITLSEPKTLGKIVTIKDNLKGNVVLKNCKVLKKASYYWSDSLGGGWKPLLEKPDDRLFEIRDTRNDVTLQWVYNNSTRNSWFHGRVFRLSIQCTGITSTIIFKSRKNYNQDDFIGCLNPDNTTTSLRTAFNCSAMTPTMCEHFCQRHGHSVAMLKQGTQCSCSEYSQVMFWDKTRFSCSIPCGGDGETFCGGKETYSAYRTMLEWPNDFTFSSNGSLNSMEYRCTQIEQPSPSTSWNNTYLCAKKMGTNPRLRWYSQKPRERILANRRCIAINQTSNSSSWKDNFLCVSKEVGLLFTWSYFGHPDGMECLKMEAEESLGWENNYLCADHTKENQTMVSALCPNTTSTRPTYPTVATSTRSSMPRTEQKDRSSDALPHSPEYPVSSLSTGPNSGSNQDSNKKEKDNLELIPLYVFVTFASVLCVLVFGVLAMLYLKKKIKSTQSLNSQARITNYDNPIWQKTGRKSRKERLPSLPALAGETHPPQTPNTTHESFGVPSKPHKTQPENPYYITPETVNTTKAPLKLPIITNERNRTSTMENGVYAEIPVASNVDPVNTSESGDQRNNVGRCNNPTYESIDNCLNPESVYLEVLP